MDLIQVGIYGVQRIRRIIPGVWASVFGLHKSAVGKLV